MLFSILKIVSPPYERGSDNGMESSRPMATPASERPVASFVLSLIAGLLVLVGSAVVTGFSSGLPYSGGMMGGYHYGEMMGGYYGMMRGFGFGGGWFYGLAAIA